MAFPLNRDWDTHLSIQCITFCTFWEPPNDVLKAIHSGLNLGWVVSGVSLPVLKHRTADRQQTSAPLRDYGKNYTRCYRFRYFKFTLVLEYIKLKFSSHLLSFNVLTFMFRHLTDTFIQKSPLEKLRVKCLAQGHNGGKQDSIPQF